MVYKKITYVAISIAIIACIVSNVAFGANITTNDQIYDSILNALIFLQKYSWPVILLLFIYAIYEFYVVGSEVLDHKIKGQRMIVGVAIFMAIFQCLPLLYAFITVAQ